MNILYEKYATNDEKNLSLKFGAVVTFSEPLIVRLLLPFFDVSTAGDIFFWPGTIHIQFKLYHSIHDLNASISYSC